MDRLSRLPDVCGKQRDLWPKVSRCPRWEYVTVTCTVSREGSESERQYKQGPASGRRGRSEMDRHDAVHGRSDSDAATDLPADDAGSDEQLRPTLEHPTLLHLPTTARRRPTGHGADLPSSFGAVDGAIHSPTGGIPAGGPAVVECLHGPLQTSQVNLVLKLSWKPRRFHAPSLAPAIQSVLIDNAVALRRWNYGLSN